MNVAKMYVQYAFWVLLFFINIPLIGSDVSHGQNSHDKHESAIIASPQKKIMRWYWRPMVKNVLFGVTVTVLGGYIVYQSGVISVLQRTVIDNENIISDCKQKIAKMKKTIGTYKQKDQTFLPKTESVKIEDHSSITRAVNGSESKSSYENVVVVLFALVGALWMNSQ